jgi:hypothetical protein
MLLTAPSSSSSSILVVQVLREGKMVTLVGAKEEDFEGPIAELVALSGFRICRFID